MEKCWKWTNQSVLNSDSTAFCNKVLVLILYFSSHRAITQTVIIIINCFLHSDRALNMIPYQWLRKYTGVVCEIIYAIRFLRKHYPWSKSWTQQIEKENNLKTLCCKHLKICFLQFILTSNTWELCGTYFPSEIYVYCA